MGRLGFARYLWRASQSVSDFYRIYGSVIWNKWVMTPAPSANPEKFNLCIGNHEMEVWMRRHTTDIPCFHEIFFQEIYRLPSGHNPRTVIDMGANIGLASLFFCANYSDTVVYAFEPMQANYEVLKLNVQNFSSRIHCCPFGLSNKSEDTTFSIPAPGRFWDFRRKIDETGKFAETISLQNARDVFQDLQINNIDVLKIDVEGSEYAIFDSLRDYIPSIGILIGELHYNEGNPYDLLSILSRTHDVDIMKQFGTTSLLFRACKHQ